MNWPFGSEKLAKELRKEYLMRHSEGHLLERVKEGDISQSEYDHIQYLKEKKRRKEARRKARHEARIARVKAARAAIEKRRQDRKKGIIPEEPKKPDVIMIDLTQDD